MRAIILAAGEGSRLRPYTEDRPKCLVELAGRPLLEWQARTLRAAGIGEIVVVTGYRADQVEALGFKTRHNPRYAETNMVASLMCAREELRGDTDVIIAYADILYEVGIVEDLARCESPLCTTIDLEWRALWGLRMADPLDDAETLRMDGEGFIIDLGRKPKSLEEIEGQYMGLIRVSASLAPRLIEAYGEIEARGDKSAVERMYMTDFLRHLAAHVSPLKAVPVRRGWLEVDSREDLETYRRMYERGELTTLLKLDETGAGAR
jgi:L-glutamine-phosphate cytidylyltransferase